MFTCQFLNPLTFLGDHYCKRIVLILSQDNVTMDPINLFVISVPSLARLLDLHAVISDPQLVLIDFKAQSSHAIFALTLLSHCI